MNGVSVYALLQQLEGPLRFTTPLRVSDGHIGGEELLTDLFEKYSD
jgi:hypothetical protein